MKWVIGYFPKLWTRQKPDGRKGWGALRYLLFGGVFFAAGLWSVNRLQQGGASSRASGMMGGPARPANPAAGQVRLKEVAEAAQDTKPIEMQGTVPDTLAQSQVGLSVEQASATPTSGSTGPAAGAAGYFGETAATANTATSRSKAPSKADESNDSIFAAMARSEQSTGTDGRPASEDENASGKPDGARSRMSGRNGFGQPTLVGSGASSSSSGNQIQMPPIESLVIKDSRITPPGSGTGAGDGLLPADAIPRRFLPRGEIIPVYVMQTVETGRFPTLVQFAVAKTIWFNGKPVIPFGTRFMATAGLSVRDRITFNVDSLRRRDGLEIACQAIVLGSDQATGVKAYYLPPPALVQAAPYVASFAQAYADLMKLRASSTSIQIGSVGISSSQRSDGQVTQEAAIASASQALSDFLASQLTDLKERFAGYLTVPEGTSGFVQLTANTDFTALWDDAPRGTMRTVGTPAIVSTESVYRQREQEKNQNQTFASLLTAGASPAPSPAPQANAKQPAAPLAANAPAAPAVAIQDPFAK